MSVSSTHAPILRKWFWMLMTVSYLAVSFVVTRGSVLGGWDTHVLGIPHAAVWDPGGMYLGNGLLLFGISSGRGGRSGAEPLHLPKGGAPRRS